MKKLKKVEPAEWIDGKLVIDLDADETNFDWIRTARLKKELSKAEYKKRIAEMDQNPTYIEEE